MESLTLATVLRRPKMVGLLARSSGKRFASNDDLIQEEDGWRRNSTFVFGAQHALRKLLHRQRVAAGTVRVRAASRFGCFGGGAASNQACSHLVQLGGLAVAAWCADAENFGL